MSNESISVSLHASWAPQSRLVKKSDFIDQLKMPVDNPYEEVAEAAGAMDSWVELISAGIESFDSHKAFADFIASKFAEISVWLDARAQEDFHRMKVSGLSIRLFINLWISQDQFDLQLPPELLSACARLAIPIKLWSND